jgi:hypothetical protein
MVLLITDIGIKQNEKVSLIMLTALWKKVI